jgi:hypothetical protein
MTSRAEVGEGMGSPSRESLETLETLLRGMM